VSMVPVGEVFGLISSASPTAASLVGRGEARLLSSRLAPSRPPPGGVPRIGKTMLGTCGSSHPACQHAPVFQAPRTPKGG